MSLAWIVGANLDRAPISSPPSRGIAGSLVGLAVIELLSGLAGGIFSLLGAWLWLLSALLTLALSGILGLGCLREWLRHRNGMMFFTLGVLAVACFQGIGGFDRIPINFESAFQIKDGLNNWARPDLGYQLPAFLRYSSRQYLLVALPAELFGRTLINLRLGYALAFFTSFLVFLSGQYVWWRRKNLTTAAAGLLVALSGLVLLSFPLVVAWLRIFEQTILPLSFTMMAAGWLLVWLAGAAPLVLLPLAWSIGMLATTYTPGLASWGLALAALAYLYWIRPSASASPRRALIPVAFYAAAFGCVSFYVLRRWLPDRLSPPPTLEIAGAITRVKEGFSALVFPKLYALFTPWIALPILFPLLATLAGRGGNRRLAYGGVWIWSVAAIIAGLVMKGWVQRPAEIDLHRALVITAPLVWLAADFWAEKIRGPSSAWTLALRAYGLWLGVMVCLQLTTPRDIGSFQLYGPNTDQFFIAEIHQFNRDLPVQTPLQIVVDPEAPISNGVVHPFLYFFPASKFERRVPDVPALLAARRPFVAVVKKSQFSIAGLAQSLARISFLTQPIPDLKTEDYVVVQVTQF